MATESDNVNSGALGTLVAVGTIAFFGIALVITALVRAEMAGEVAKKEVSVDRPYKDLVAEQTAKLAAPASYVDRGKGVVALPIERAMELTVEGLKKDPNSATPPAPAGGGGSGSGGSGGASSAGAGGLAGTGGAAKPADEAVHAAEKPEEPKPAEEPKEKGEEKKSEQDKEQKKAPKPNAPAPTAPAPAPNGQ